MIRGSYKNCFVPQCTHTTVSTPDKLFITVPKSEPARTKWFKVCRREDQGSLKTAYYCCEDHFNADGRTLPGSISQTPGGVARNIADALAKLVVDSPPPLFITTLGHDQFGRYLSESVAHTDDRGVEMIEGERTACFFGLVDDVGEARIGVGDFDVFRRISSDLLRRHENVLKKSEMIIMDGNLPSETVEFLLNLASSQDIPVWFEPTDILTAAKPFSSELWKTIACASPNVGELIEMAKAVGVNFESNLDFKDFETAINQIIYLAVPIVNHIPLLMITMGQHGILMITKYEATETPLLKLTHNTEDTITVRHYPTRPVDRVVNCLGAGDSTAAGFISGLIRGLREPECIQLGQRASAEALACQRAIPERMTHDRLTVISSDFREIRFEKILKNVV